MDTQIAQTIYYHNFMIYPVLANMEPLNRWAVQALGSQITEKYFEHQIYFTADDAKISIDLELSRLEKAAELAAIQIEIEKKLKLNEFSIQNDPNSSEFKVNKFLDSSGYTALKKGKAKSVLIKPTRFEGVFMSQLEFVEKIISHGYVTSSEEVNKIQPMSRMAYFRATNEQQAAHEKKIKLAGKKTVYSLSHDIYSYDIGKFEFDYANYHINR